MGRIRARWKALNLPETVHNPNHRFELLLSITGMRPLITLVKSWKNVAYALPKFLIALSEGS